jgi:hypothetical protein
MVFSSLYSGQFKLDPVGDASACTYAREHDELVTQDASPVSADLLSRDTSAAPACTQFERHKERPHIFNSRSCRLDLERARALDTARADARKVAGGRAAILACWGGRHIVCREHLCPPRHGNGHRLHRRRRLQVRSGVTISMKNRENVY